LKLWGVSISAVGVCDCNAAPAVSTLKLKALSRVACGSLALSLTKVHLYRDGALATCVHQGASFNVETGRVRKERPNG